MGLPKTPPEYTDWKPKANRLSRRDAIAKQEAELRDNGQIVDDVLAQIQSADDLNAALIAKLSVALDMPSYMLGTPNTKLTPKTFIDFRRIDPKPCPFDVATTATLAEQEDILLYSSRLYVRIKNYISAAFNPI